jgi:hypothetical protein
MLDAKADPIRRSFLRRGTSLFLDVRYSSRPPASARRSRIQPRAPS